MKLTILNRQRAAVTFTLLLFMMLLISVALMYYYFMRTRALQAEVAELKQKIPGAMKIEVESTEDTDLAQTDTLGSALNNVSNALASTTQTVSRRETPAPQVATPEVAPTSTEPVITPEVTPAPTPPPAEPTLSVNEETPELPQEPEASPTPVKPIKSMYDVERPAMKIRTPRRPAPDQ